MGSLPMQVAAGIYLYRCLVGWLFRHAELTEEAYGGPILLGKLLGDPSVATFLVLHLAAALVGGEALGWKVFDARGRARAFVLIVAGIFLWTYALGAPNPFFHQAYWVDRIVLSVLWILIWRHPGFVGPFLLVFAAIALQGYHPLPEPGWMWPDKRLPLDALLVFEVTWGVRLLWRSRGRRELLPLLLLAITGAHYAHAGWNKLMLGPRWSSWPLDNDLSNLFVSAYVQAGWLAGLGPERVVEVAKGLHAVRVPLAFGALAIELSGFLLLFSWRYSRLALCGFVVLHLGILAASGIFFWKWIVCDLALLWYLARWREEDGGRNRAEKPARRWFSPLAVVVGTLAIVGSPGYFNNVSFAWFDTRLVNTYRIEGVGTSGATYPIHPRFFAPYDLVVQQSRFYFASDADLLVGTYGTSMRYEVLRALQRASPEDLPRLRELLGYRAYDPEDVGDLERFLRRSLEWRRPPPRWLRWLGPPFHFRGSVPANAYAFQEPLECVRVTLEESLYDGARLTMTRRLPVLDLELESPGL